MSQNSLNKLNSVIKIKNFKLYGCRELQIWRSIIPAISIVALLYFTLCSGILYSQEEKLEIDESQMELEILQRDFISDSLLIPVTVKDSLKAMIAKRLLNNPIKSQRSLQKVADK